MRPRSANEWRSFWHQGGGEQELESLLREAWQPLRDAGAAAAESAAQRIALLLGSAAPARALAAELGRIRAGLGVGVDADADAAAAAAVHAWFETRKRVDEVSCGP